MNRVKRLCQWLQRRRYAAILVAVGVGLALPSLTVGIQTDDYTIRAIILGQSAAIGVTRSPWAPFTFLDGDPASNHKLMDVGFLPWWTHPRCRATFMRPLTALTYLADYRLWPRFPVLMHVHSLAWFALLLWAATALYRRLLAGRAAAWVAVLAALLFAVDDAHGLPAGWLANRNALLSGAFGVLALLAHHRWRAEAWRPGAVLAPLALAAALLGKEEAVCVGAYLLAYAVFLDRAPWSRRLASLLPGLLVGVAWYGCYRALGFGVAASGMYIDPAHDPVRFARQVARSAPVLLLGQWGLPESDLSAVLSTAAFRVHWLWAAVFLGLVGVLLAPLVARDRLARFWALGMVLSVVPVCAAFPMDRLMMFAGLGAFGLLAQWLGGMSDGAGWVPSGAAWRRLAAVFGVVFLAVHLVVAPLRLPLRTLEMRVVGMMAEWAFEGLPSDPALGRQTVVFVNPIASAAPMLWMHMQRDRGLPVPVRSLSLGPSWATVSVRRVDERTLAVRPRGGYLAPRGRWPDPSQRPPLVSFGYVARYFDLLFRSEALPMELGERVELTAATVEVTALTDDGRPAEVLFRFKLPLDDPSLRWLELRGNRPVLFTPPAVGGTVEVPSPLARPRAAGRP